jgi:prepilin-type N-terminal cleavage/methylation domain-containing protein
MRFEHMPTPPLGRKGLSLLELMVVVVIMVVIASAVTRITMQTSRLVLMGAQESVAESSAKNVLKRIAEDVRSAGEKTGGAGGAGPFWDSSDDTNIFITKYGRNMDAFSVPNNGDIHDDIACYQYYPSNGVRGDDNYIPGRIMYGVDSGDSLCSSSDMAQLSDVSLDVRNFSIEYCRPAPGVPGTYSCSPDVEQPGTIGTNSSCVWLVKLHISAQRLAKRDTTAIAGPDTIGAVVDYSTAVKPRNIYLAALNTNTIKRDKDDLIDCCDSGNIGGSDITWCPPPKK